MSDIKHYKIRLLLFIWCHILCTNCCIVKKKQRELSSWNKSIVLPASYELTFMMGICCNVWCLTYKTIFMSVINPYNKIFSHSVSLTILPTGSVWAMQINMCSNWTDEKSLHAVIASNWPISHFKHWLKTLQQP